MFTFPITLFGAPVGGGGSWDLSANVVAQYKMNDDAANTTVANEEGTDGTLAGGDNTADISVTGKINDAFDFNGVDDYVDTNQTFQSTFQDSFSFECWAKFDDGQATIENICGVFNDDTVGGTQHRAYLFNLGGVFSCWYESDNNLASAKTSTAVFPSGATGWYHLVATIDETNGIKLYINNVEQTLGFGDDGDMSSVTMADFLSDSHNLYVGALNNDGSLLNYFAGLIDNFRIFDKELSAQEVSDLYNGGSGTENNFYGYTLDAGAEKVFNIASTYDTSVTMMDSTHAIVCYSDIGNSDYGTAVCLTLSGTTITAGSEFIFHSGSTFRTSITMMDSTHAIVCYKDGGNSNYGTAVCLTLSGTTITAGSEVVFNSAGTNFISVTMMDSTHAIVCYQDDGNSDYGTAVCLTLSGTTITAGNEVIYSSSSTAYISVTMMDSTHAIVCYTDGGNSTYGTAVCLTLSGTTITAGNEVIYNSSSTAYSSATMMDSAHAIVCYQDGGNSDYGTAVCLTLSGTTITAGSEVVFNSAGTTYISVTMMGSTHAIVCYQDHGNSDYGTAVCLTLSGTTITAGNEVIYSSSSTFRTSVTMMDSTHAIVCYDDGGNSNYGTACCLYFT